MAAWVHPPLSPDALRRAEDESLANETKWFLDSLQGSLRALKENLQECADLLAPMGPGSTLVLSSPRSESVKGFVTRVGTRIVKGEIHLRLRSLPLTAGRNYTQVHVSTAPTATELVLNQLVGVRRLINDSLDVVDVSTFTGDPLDASFIAGQLRLLHDHLVDAKLLLRGDTGQTSWMEDSAVVSSFDPPLPPNLSFHLSVSEATLILSLRTLDPTPNTFSHAHDQHFPSSISTSTSSSALDLASLALGSFSLRDHLFGPRLPHHDETGAIFRFADRDVHVVEKIRVDSQDPNLMSAMAKLAALEHEVGRWRRALAAVTEAETDEEGE